MRLDPKMQAISGFVAYLAGALVCAASANAGAVPKTAQAPLAEFGTRLKLDSGIANFALIAGAEDCEEEGDLFVRTMPASVSGSDSARHQRAAPLRLALADSSMTIGAKSASDAGVPKVAAAKTDAVRETDAAPVGPGWEIFSSDKTLNAALARWAAAAGWQLVWELPVDYAVATHTTVHGSFEEAVSIVARSMGGAEIPLRAIFYGGNKVLRIVPKGVE